MSNLDIIKSKIYSAENFVRQLNIWRFQSKKMVFTNGCFDILHLGHVDYLSKAADLGNILIVGINTDSSVKRLGKGKNRPIQDENSRAVILASLHFIDAVILFEEDTPYELIKLIQPHVLVKGGDWKKEDIVGYDIVMKGEGLVKTVDYLPGFSTTLIEEKIIKG